MICKYVFKRCLSLILVGVVVLCITACSAHSDSNKESDKVKETSSETTTEQTDYSKNQEGVDLPEVVVCPE